MIPQLNTCCFCGTLRIGTIILLVLHLIVSIIAISDLTFQNDAYNKHTYTSRTGKSTTRNYPTLDQIYPFGYWGSLVMVTLTAVVSVIGLCGVYKKNHSYLAPYLAWKIIDALVVIGCLLAVMSWDLFLTELIPLILYVYFWLVVFSYYRVLKGSEAEINPA